MLRRKRWCKAHLFTLILCISIHSNWESGDVRLSESFFHFKFSREWDSRRRSFWQTLAAGGLGNSSIAVQCVFISAFLLHPAGVPQHLLSSSPDSRAIRGVSNHTQSRAAVYYTTHNHRRRYFQLSHDVNKMLRQLILLKTHRAGATRLMIRQKKGQEATADHAF